MEKMSIDPPSQNRDLNFFKKELNETDKLTYAAENGATNFWMFIDPINKDHPIPRAKPYELKKELDQAIPTKRIANLRFTRKGSILIQASDLQTAKYISSVQSILGTKVHVKTIPEHITSRFLVRNIHQDIPLEELANEIEKENNIQVLELKRFINREKTPSQTVLVTILGFKIPIKLRLWYQQIDIELFLDKPRQCRKCWRYGHPEKYCISTPLCDNCGDDINNESHKNTPCPNQSKCLNCQEDHAATNKICSKYKNEVKLCEFRATNHLPLGEAKRIFYADTKRQKASFAQITNQPSSEFVTKTELQKSLTELTIGFQNIVANICASQINVLTDKMTELGAIICNAVQNATKPTSNKSSQPLPKRKRKTITRKSPATNLQTPIVSDDSGTPTVEDSLYDVVKTRNRGETSNT